MASSTAPAAAPAPAADASTPTTQRPRVAVLYSHASTQSREGELSAKYLGLCMAASGQCEKVFVVGLDPSSSTSQQAPTSSTSSAADVQTKALRSDGLVIDASALGNKLYEETRAHQVLAQCHVWILLLDVDATATSMQFLQKRIKKSTDKQSRRVVVSLQTALRQLKQLEQGFADSAVLNGGLGFQVIPQHNTNVLAPLSNGCIYVERLAAEKVDALYVLDLLESTGLQVLSRRNIQALKWGTTMLRTFYYINALTGASVAASLQDRPTRLLFLETLYEMSTLFARVMEQSTSSANSRSPPANTTSWLPDAIACSYVSIDVLMKLLPLPNVLFNVVLCVVDVGLYTTANATSVTMSDVAANRTTSFASEFSDVFELARHRSIALPALALLRDTLASTTVTAHAGVPHIAGSVLASNVALSREARAASRTFFFKLVVTLLATLVLVLFLFRR